MKVTEHLKKNVYYIHGLENLIGCQFSSINIQNKSNPNKKPSNIFVELYKQILNIYLNVKEVKWTKQIWKIRAKNNFKFPSAYPQQHGHWIRIAK